MNYNPKKIGDQSHYAFITKCLMNNWEVWNSVGDASRVDCIIDRGNGLERVQIKTGRYINGVVIFSTKSSHYHTKRGQETKYWNKNYIGQIDIFGVYCTKLARCYIVPIEETRIGDCYLRITQPQKSNQRGNRFAIDYEI